MSDFSRGFLLGAIVVGAGFLYVASQSQSLPAPYRPELLPEPEEQDTDDDDD